MMLERLGYITRIVSCWSWRVGIESGDVRSLTFFVFCNIYVYHDVMVLSPGMFDPRHFMFSVIFMFIMTCWYWVWGCSIPGILCFL